MTNDSDLIFSAGNFSWNIGQYPSGFHGVHGGYGVGSRIEKGTKLLEFSYAN